MSLKKKLEHLSKRAFLFSKKKTKEDLTATHVYKAAKKNRMPSWSQWTQLPSLLSKGERKTARTALVTGLVATVVVIGGLYFSNRILVPAIGGNYTEGLVGEPQFINPILAPGNTVDTDLTKLVFRGLLTYDPTEGLVPELANSYEVDEEGTTYTINLREDVTWHDGETFSSQDVVFTFQAIANPEYKSPLALSFRGVTVEAIDDLTVVFTLPEPFAPFPASLTVGILPSHIWESVSPKRALLTNLNLQPIGNGPYKFEKFSKDQNGTILSYTLSRYKNFYGSKPLIEDLSFKFYPDVLTATEALRNRNVEGLAFIPEEVAADLEENRFIQIVRPNLPQETVVIFNDSRNDVLKNENLRLALDAAIGRDEIIEEVFNGNARELAGPLLPGTLATDLEPKKRDIERAEELMDKTDWERDPITHLRTQESDDDEEEPTVLSLEITTVDSPDMLALAEKLKEFWSPLGIEVQIKSAPQTTFHNNVIKPRAYDILLTGLLFGIDPDPFPFWHSSQINDPGVNLANYSNRKVDDALETGRESINPEDRLEAYETFQDLILEDSPALFIVQPTYSYATASKIHGIELQNIVTPSDRFSRIETWYIKTKKAFRLTK